jgi:hypothetical protein
LAFVKECERDWRCPRESCAPCLRNRVPGVETVFDRLEGVGGMSDNRMLDAREIQGTIWIVVQKR